MFEGHSDIVRSLAITNDNKLIISGARDNTVRIWNIVEKRLEAILQGHLDSVRTVAVSNDNKFAVSGARDKTIRV